jgi:hypothetical protein
MKDGHCCLVSTAAGLEFSFFANIHRAPGARVVSM